MNRKDLKRYYFDGNYHYRVSDIEDNFQEIEESIKDDLIKGDLRFELTPEKIIFNPPATIVWWSDGTKTVVKTADGDVFDAEYGVAMAVMRRFFNSRSAYMKFVEKGIFQQL